jgi:hypothetical protein
MVFYITLIGFLSVLVAQLLGVLAVEGGTFPLATGLTFTALAVAAIAAVVFREAGQSRRTCDDDDEGHQEMLAPLSKDEMREFEQAILRRPELEHLAGQIRAQGRRPIFFELDRTRKYLWATEYVVNHPNT